MFLLARCHKPCSASSCVAHRGRLTLSSFTCFVVFFFPFRSERTKRKGGGEKWHGCTILLLFRGGITSFGLHHGVQLDRIGAWARKGGARWAIGSGRSSYLCFCSRSHGTTSGHLSTPHHTSTSTSTHHHRRKKQTISRTPANFYKIRQIPRSKNTPAEQPLGRARCGRRKKVSGICFNFWHGS